MFNQLLPHDAEGDRQLKLPSLTKILGFVAGAIIAAEGVLITAYAAPVTVNGIGGIMGQTVLIAGIQLLILGILISGAWFLRDKEFRLGRISRIVGRFLPIAGIILGCAVALEGAVVAVNAGATVWGGIGGIMESTVALAGAQLFCFGLFATSLWFLKEDEEAKASLSKLVGIVAVIGISAEGLLVMGLASPAVVDGIGGITQPTVFNAGVSLFILGLIALGGWMLREKDFSFLRKYGILERLPSYLILGASFAVTIEALFVMNQAAFTVIQSIGGIMESTIMLGGVQLLVFAALQPLILGVPFVAEDKREARTALLALLFLMLLVPAAMMF